MPDQIIRPSSLVTEADCSRRWAAHHLQAMALAAGYTLAPRRPTHVGAAVGSGVHAGAGYTMEMKRLTGDLGNAREAEDRAEAEFFARTEDGVVWDPTTAAVSVAQKQVQRMTRSYRRYLAPTLMPMLVEVRLEAEIGDGWVMSGQGDLLSADSMTGDPAGPVRDLKTGTVQRANGVQYAGYFELFSAHGYRPTSIAEDFIRRVNVSNEQPPPETTFMDVASAKADMWSLVDDIKRSTAEFQRRVAEGDKPPNAAFRANPASQLCSAKWCAAHGTDFCKAHRR